MAAKKEPKVNIFLQYAGKSIDVEEISEAVKADWEKDHKGSVKDLALYLKSEEDTAYYVVNKEDAGSVGM